MAAPTEAHEGVEARPPAGQPAGGSLLPTLPARDYHDPHIFELERGRIFHRMWFCVGREGQLPEVGDYLQVEVVDESILIVRPAPGRLKAFYNVCRHRGSRLCDAAAGHLGGAIRCPYHSWTYSLDGRLIGTPNIGRVDGFDNGDYPLHPLAIDVWKGFIFVSLSPNPPPLAQQLGSWASEYRRYHLGRLRSGVQGFGDVAANWKILVENYNECLHCPTVHPELVRLVPLYRRGLVVEEDGSEGNRLGEGISTWTDSGRSNRPLFPDLTQEDRQMYYGFHVFPNIFVNLLPDVVMTTILFPIGADRTRLVIDYLFEPSTLTKEDFDPRDLVHFRERLLKQDWEVCENAQRGVTSRAFRSGIYPPQDHFLYEFNQQYLRERGSLAEEA